MGPRDAEYYGVKHLDRMNMRVDSPCPTTLEGLLVRTHPDWKLEVHIDTDEANCCDLPHASRVTLDQGVSRAGWTGRAGPRMERYDWLDRTGSNRLGSKLTENAIGIG